MEKSEKNLELNTFENSTVFLDVDGDSIVRTVRIFRRRVIRLQRYVGTKHFGGEGAETLVAHRATFAVHGLILVDY